MPKCIEILKRRLPKLRNAYTCKPKPERCPMEERVLGKLKDLIEDHLAESNVFVNMENTRRFPKVLKPQVSVM